MLGEGTTAKVFLAQKIDEPSKYVAIKLFREEFISKYSETIKDIEREIWIQSNLNH